MAEKITSTITSEYASATDYNLCLNTLLSDTVTKFLECNAIYQSVYTPYKIWVETDNGDALIVKEATNDKCDGLVRRRPEEAQTTDATQTTVDSITLLDENTYHIEAYVVGVESGGGNRASYHISGTFYRTGAGGATLQGAVTTVHSAESDANWDATFTVNDNDVRVSVTGVAATTIEWTATMEYINMSDS